MVRQQIRCGAMRSYGRHVQRLAWVLDHGQHLHCGNRGEQRRSQTATDDAVAWDPACVGQHLLHTRRISPGVREVVNDARLASLRAQHGGARQHQHKPQPLRRIGPFGKQQGRRANRHARYVKHRRYAKR